MNKRAFIVIPIIFLFAISFLAIPKSFAILQPTIVQFTTTTSNTCTFSSSITIANFLVVIAVARVSGGVNSSFMQAWTISDSLVNTFKSQLGQQTSGAQFSSITTLSEVWESNITNAGSDTVTIGGQSSVSLGQSTYCYEVTNNFYTYAELGASYFNTLTPVNSYDLDTATQYANALFIGAGIGFQTATNGVTGASFTACPNSDCTVNTDSLNSGVKGSFNGIVGSTMPSELVTFSLTYNSVFELAQSGVVFGGAPNTTSTSTTCTSTVTLNVACTLYVVTVYTVGTLTFTITTTSGSSTITQTITSTITTTISGSNGTLAEVFILFFILMILIMIYVMRRVSAKQILSGDSE